MSPRGWMRRVIEWFHWRRFFPGPSRSLGNDGETLAERHLRGLGYQILGRQVRLARGEIDLIAREGETIVFIEVKTRRSNRHGSPVEAVTPTKQQQLSRLALMWLKQHQSLHRSARFDVIGVLWPPDSRKPEIRHIRNAFDLQD